MRNILKATTLENKFPLFTVENGCIVSKDADITVAFRVELPELFTVTAAEYEAIHSAWNKAVKVLPDYSIVHKQDWFIKENYAPDIQKDDLSFLSRSFERHFNERPFLNHTCYLFLTKTTKERSRMQSNFSTLCRGFLVPKEIRDRETVTKFLEAVGQFESIMNDSGFITLTRLTSDEITGTKETAGIVEKYFSLSQTDTTTLKDISLGADKMKIGDNILCLHTLSDAEDMPGKVGTDTRYEKLSTDRSDCRLSFASPVGVLLSCNHIYNQYIFIDDHTENLKQFEKMARNMHSLSKYSRANQINKSWIEEYLNEAHSQGLSPCDAIVISWLGVTTGKNSNTLKMMWGHSSHLWSASHATTPPTRRPCFGREYPAIRRISRRKKVSTPLLNRLFACSPKKRTTKVRFPPLVSRWWIGSRESRCILIFQTCP